jgi:organic hydroperoxide reductase OsmC/OhrA
MNYTATVKWTKRPEELFTDKHYSRAHRWHFDGGLEVPASAPPQVVPPPMSDAAAIDPEEAFVASLASCHMLFFLSIAAAAGYVVASYTDSPTGVLAKNTAGLMAMTLVELRPKVVFEGDSQPTPDAITALHAEAHHKCFIANSVHTEIRIIEQPTR